MMRTRVAVLSLGLLGAAIAADQVTLDLGKKEEARSCVPCHSLRLIHSQRLPRATWVKELDKMTGWGTVIKDRDALLEYLVANYGNDKPIPAPDMTQNGK